MQLNSMLRKKKGLDGIDEEEEVVEEAEEPKETKSPKIMNSVDFAELNFNSIGFTGKWFDFIGDPAPGFTAMVFGMPKMGKSFLCVDFAGYLARKHGKVLYVAKEEKLDKTLQDKLKEKEVAHENLFVADSLPADLTEYDFIILDSVNKLGLSPKDLEKLKTDNKGKSFIFVFQATKGGKFKGNNEFQHDVDVVIEVPEQGKAVQFGRFNQGGEMNIFEDHDNLSGIKKTSKPIGKMEIETEVAIPLEELAMDVVSKKEPKEKIVELLDNEPEKVIPVFTKMLVSNLKDEKAKVEIKNVEFSEMDSANLNHGAAYFRVTLHGSKKELEKIAGEDMLFNYDWEEGISGIRKTGKNFELSKNVSNENQL